MSRLDEQLLTRSKARAFEDALPAAQRKSLGQFFTGLPLGRLLAHLAISPDTRTVLDPMAGHGDLLDAVWQAAIECGVPITQLDAIEIDPATAEHCRGRLDDIISAVTPERKVITGSAFEESQLKQLNFNGYDLVITNPPYVRYQGQQSNSVGPDAIRESLQNSINARAALPKDSVWQKLAECYSGLSDLSVPSWLLAGMMVRPGGKLALVAPATWRSRDYADVVRYLLLRCFTIEVIVEDVQPGWFSDALVRTHLIVARRKTDNEATPLSARECWPSASWVRVAPKAAKKFSLVGAAFPDENPEASFASWMRGEAARSIDNIERSDFNLADEWASLNARAERNRWYQELEINADNAPLFSPRPSTAATFIPPPLREILPAGVSSTALHPVTSAGIEVGQGLRTGCNSFFYVDSIGPEKAGMILIRATKLHGTPEFLVPAATLRPVIRRQAELPCIRNAEIPSGRVLDLRAWVLPEDEPVARAAYSSYKDSGREMPQVMPDDLANFVRRAGTQSIPGSKKLIPELSAVRTNVRAPGRRGQPPRFWYMLPDFALRHQPAVFIPRVIHQTPWAECNLDPAVLVDANFSTIWSRGDDWNRHSLVALLNSVWCRASMELLGTPLGGGALKLEATHLRQLLIPRLDDEEKHALTVAGAKIDRDDSDVQAAIDKIVLNSIITKSANDDTLPIVARGMATYAQSMRNSRQKASL